MTMPEPGWYQDPSRPGSHRWWDGAGWTDQLLSNVSVGNGLSAPGDWFGEALRLARARAGHLFTIVVLVTVPATIVAGLLSWLALDGTVLENIGPDADGFPRAVGFTGIGALYGFGSIVISLLASAIAIAAMTHQVSSNEAADEAERAMIGRRFAEGDAEVSRFMVQAEHTEVDSCPWNDSLAFVLRRPFRVIGALIGPIVAAIGIMFLAGVAAAVFPPLVILIFGSFAAAFMIVVRSALGLTAATLSPSSVSSLGSSRRLTSGIFFPVLGRLALLVVAAVTVQIFSAFLTAPIAAAFGGEGLAPGATEIDLRAFLGGNPAAYLASRVVGSVVSGMTLALVSAGLFIVYRDRGGDLDADLAETHGRANTLGPVT